MRRLLRGSAVLPLAVLAIAAAGPLLAQGAREGAAERAAQAAYDAHHREFDYLAWRLGVRPDPPVSGRSGPGPGLLECQAVSRRRHHHRRVPHGGRQRATSYVSTTLRVYSATQRRWNILGIEPGLGVLQIGTGMAGGEATCGSTRSSPGAGRTRALAHPLSRHPARPVLLARRPLHRRRQDLVRELPHHRGPAHRRGAPLASLSQACVPFSPVDAPVLPDHARRLGHGHRAGLTSPGPARPLDVLYDRPAPITSHPIPPRARPGNPSLPGAALRFAGEPVVLRDFPSRLREVALPDGQTIPVAAWPSPRACGTGSGNGPFFVTALPDVWTHDPRYAADTGISPSFVRSVVAHELVHTLGMTGTARRVESHRPALSGISLAFDDDMIQRRFGPARGRFDGSRGDRPPLQAADEPRDGSRERPDPPGPRHARGRRAGVFGDSAGPTARWRTCSSTWRASRPGARCSSSLAASPASAHRVPGHPAGEPEVVVAGGGPRAVPAGGPVGAGLGEPGDAAGDGVSRRAARVGGWATLRSVEGRAACWRSRRSYPTIQQAIDSAAARRHRPGSARALLREHPVQGTRDRAHQPVRPDRRPGRYRAHRHRRQPAAHPDTASVVMFVIREDSAAVLQGFTITGGNGTVWLDAKDHLSSAKAAASSASCPRR